MVRRKIEKGKIVMKEAKIERGKMVMNEKERKAVCKANTLQTANRKN